MEREATLTTDPTTKDLAPPRASPDAPLLAVASAAMTVVLGIIAIKALEYNAQGKGIVVAAVLAAPVAALAGTYREHLHEKLGAARAGAVLILLWTTALLLVALVVTTTFAEWPTRVIKAADAEGRFDEPDEGDVVSTGLSLNGTATIPADAALWLLIEQPDNLLHTTTPYPVRVQQGGRWEVQGVGVGRDQRDARRSYRFVLVGVPSREDPIARALAAARPDGSTSVVVDPGPGAQELDSVHVTLGEVDRSLVSASVDSLEDGGTVPLPTKSRVEGTLSAPLPEGWSLWIAQRAEGEQLFHPQDEACVIDRLRFNCPPLYLGVPADAGKAFDVYVWAADQDATALLVAQGGRPRTDTSAYAGLMRPDGVQEVDRVAVVRS